MSYVVDTHALVWFLTKNPRLGTQAHNILRQADTGQTVIILPIIVLVEIMSICKAGKAPLEFDSLIVRLERRNNYHIAPLDISILQAANQLQTDLEMHDRLIVTTAKLFDVPVLTKDRQIINSAMVDIIW